MIGRSSLVTPQPRLACSCDGLKGETGSASSSKASTRARSEARVRPLTGRSFILLMWNAVVCQLEFDRVPRGGAAIEGAE